VNLKVYNNHFQRLPNLNEFIMMLLLLKITSTCKQ
jgi:hypothetical protein